MSIEVTKARITEYLRNPDQFKRPDNEDDLHMLYLISYLGYCFIEGYRVLEIINNNIILSLMEYQFN
jgi:hypothetical protein